ncbi:STAS domain-containing protein [Rossellomorea vietnamensis]|uniref:STAS domain-containing protein n=1 Tax=Rossellomorea vietnamensis TaxID=218284 RepID=A0A5D4NMC9_9BACI|nr:RsbT co-antagonist protein RsbRA [Rossellomorea vietnamensis]TYS14804.1 STAS domain-containing protein [Rossellomorea vietnamensis]
MFNDLIGTIKDNKSEFVTKWIEMMKDESDDIVTEVVSDQIFVKTSHEFVDLVVSNLEDSDEYTSRLVNFSEKIVGLGWPLTFVTSGLRMFERIVYDYLSEDGTINNGNHVEAVKFFDKWLSPMYKEIVNAYAKTWEKTVSLQKIALQELSAPLIPVFEKISVMPLVGTIDTERARLIMENLLTGVVKHRAEVVLIDITGVPVVDTMVAHHIIQASEAVRLVGAQCMLVGIRPEIAQTIVNLGIDLNQFSTNSTLRKGIEKALEMTNRKIVSTEGTV